MLPRDREDTPVALVQTIGREREFAKGVGGEPVDAGLVEEEFRPELENAFESAIQRGQEFTVTGAGGQFQVEAALLLSEREVRGTVNRNRECFRIVGQQQRCSVTLVDIAVEYRGAPEEAPLAAGTNRDHEVVEDAESRAAVAKGVMRASGKIASPAGGDRFVDRGERSADGAKCPLNELWRPGEPDAAHDRGINRAIDNGTNVSRIVRQFYKFNWRGVRGD